MSEVRLGEPAGRWVLAAAVLGSSVVLLDSTVVNVALPALGRDLDASMAGVQGTVNGYALTLAAFLLLGGAMGDRWGRRRLFVLGTVWFALASLLCAAAPTIEVLVAARVLQGVGGALLTPGSLALLQASFAPGDRARAIGAWSGLGGLAAAAGPLVGGWLVEGPGWRWIFLLNLPVAAVVVAIALRSVPESRSDTTAGRFDLAGAVTGAAGLAALTYALIAAGEGRLTEPPGLAAAVAGVAGLVAFVLVERRGSHPMVPPGIFRSTQFTAANLVTLAVYAALSGVFFFLVLALQVVAGLSPTAAGSALIPITLLLLVLSSRAGALAQRIGPRRPMTVGPALCAVGVLLLLDIDTGTSYVEVLPGVVVFGLGLSLLVAPLTATVLAAAEQRHAGVASGINNAVARTAGLLAVAALPLAAGLGGEEYLDPAAMAASYQRAMVLCAVLLLVGAVLAWVYVRDSVLAAEPAEPR